MFASSFGRVSVSMAPSLARCGRCSSKVPGGCTGSKSSVASRPARFRIYAWGEPHLRRRDPGPFRSTHDLAPARMAWKKVRDLQVSTQVLRTVLIIPADIVHIAVQDYPAAFGCVVFCDYRVEELDENKCIKKFIGTERAQRGK